MIKYTLGTREHKYLDELLKLLEPFCIAKVAISNADISPTIQMGTNVADTSESFVGGVIGFVLKNTTHEREISFDTVTMKPTMIENEQTSS